MKLKIFSPVVNFPQFLELQCIQFKENLLCDYDFYAIDDSKDDSISLEFQKICEDYNAFYVKNSNVKNLAPSYAHANSIQYALDNIVYDSCLDDIVFFIDSDCFLMEKMNLVEYMEDKKISSFTQSRQDVNYLWPGFTLLNMSKIRNSQNKIKFFPGVFGEQLCDAGGESHVFLKENNIMPYPIDCIFEGIYRGQQLLNMETFMDGKFLHFRGGSLWDGKLDVFDKKIEILNNILNHGQK
jgi:glycosyltransferase involved in cell wall biosynthesis